MIFYPISRISQITLALSYKLVHLHHDQQYKDDMGVQIWMRALWGHEPTRRSFLDPFTALETVDELSRVFRGACVDLSHS